MKVACPTCRKSLRIDKPRAGGTVTCPACGGRFALPGVPAAENAAPAEAPPHAAGPSEAGGAIVVPARPLVWLLAGIVIGATPLLIALLLVLRHHAQQTPPVVHAAPPAVTAPTMGTPAPTSHPTDVPTTGPTDAPVSGAGNSTTPRPITPPPHSTQPAPPPAVAAINPGDTATAPTPPAATAPPAPPGEADPASKTGSHPADPPKPFSEEAKSSPSPAPNPPADPSPAAEDTKDQPDRAPAPPAPAPPEAAPVERRPPIQPSPIPLTGEVDDAMIEESIKAGIEHLALGFDRRSAQLKEARASRDAYGAGLNALAVYALLQAGLAVNDERLSPEGELGKALLDAVKRPIIKGGPETYARAMRAACLSLFNRPEDLETLTEDVNCLLNGHNGGAYSYRSAYRVGSSTYRFEPIKTWDNSNTQYGLLGVWLGADAGVPVPAGYWETAQEHWTGCQLTSGQWGYGALGGNKARVGYLAMTSAGIASLFVIRDQLDAAEQDASVGRPPFSRALEKGLAWFERGDNAINIENPSFVGQAFEGYTMYGVERVGLASGFKYFGKHDWYRTLALRAINAQSPDGGWGETKNHAFTLLFLARGKHPILFNKLRFDGAWGNRLRDTAGLTRYVAKQLERPLNWQVVSLNQPWEDWLDAPVLYLASHKKLTFTEEELEKLRNYALAGGVLFTHADGGSEAFDEYAADLAEKLFPQHKFADLDKDHPIYHSMFRLERRLPLRGVSNGSRILMLHSAQDLAESWQLREEKVSPDAFKLGANIFVYAAGKRDLRNRLQSPHIPDPQVEPPLGALPVVRLEYEGNSDPEPWAWVRFDRLMQYRTGIGVEVSSLKLDSLAADVAPLAHLTGTAAHRLTDEELKAIEGYVQAGGVLLVDDCGGSGNFYNSIRSALSDLAGTKPTRLPPDHPLLREGQPGMLNLPEPQLRQFAAELVSKENATIEILPIGKGHVVLSRLDLTTGLLGTGTWGIIGFAPAWAEAFMQNLVLWTLDRQT